jgi:hypothetical protein
VHTIFLIITVITFNALLAVPAAYFTRSKYVLANMEEVDVPQSWYRCSARSRLPERWAC